MTTRTYDFSTNVTVGNYYIHDGTGKEIGDIIDFTPIYDSTSYWAFAIIPCKAGDNFTIASRGILRSRAWAFTDNDHKLISVSAERVDFSGTKEAPADGYFIYQTYNTAQDKLDITCILTREVESKNIGDGYVVTEDDDNGKNVGIGVIKKNDVNVDLVKKSRNIGLGAMPHIPDVNGKVYVDDIKNKIVCPHDVNDVINQGVFIGSKSYGTTIIGNQEWTTKNLDEDLYGLTLYNIDWSNKSDGEFYWQWNNLTYTVPTRVNSSTIKGISFYVKPGEVIDCKIDNSVTKTMLVVDKNNKVLYNNTGSFGAMKYVCPPDAYMCYMNYDPTREYWIRQSNHTFDDAVVTKYQCATVNASGMFYSVGNHVGEEVFRSSDNNFNSGYVAVTPGEKYLITGYNRTDNAKLWAFLNCSSEPVSETVGILVQKPSSTGSSLTCDYVTVPTSANYLVINWRNVGAAMPTVHKIETVTPIEEYYNDNERYGKTYGKLYNWYAICQENGIMSPVMKAITPAGWRVPTITDFAYLNTLPGVTVAGLKATNIWQTAGTNETKFTALPGGYNYKGTGYNISTSCRLYSSTDVSISVAYRYGIDNTTTSIASSGNKDTNSFSVRLVRDVAAAAFNSEAPDLSPYTLDEDEPETIVDALLDK